ncbi:MAG TPA: hypothetical protein VHQ01_02995 [Pyrinomonadaceae bacterium]|jgi:hypothetical protein|nr:hypothetical protein [Pyrinomonadaceae bacterium]
MLLIIAVLAILSAAFLLFRFTRRHDPELSDQRSFSIEPPPNARPLFEPSEKELKQEADSEAARSIARREYRAKAEARAAVDDALAVWRTAPDCRNAAELLRVTATSGLDGDFSRAAGEIIEVFRGSGIDRLTDNDLAALLDSHIGLLSVSERGSGAIFWLKQEVAKLRSEGDV